MPPTIKSVKNKTAVTDLVVLDVSDVATVLPIGKNIVALSGTEITINCTVNGLPRPNVTWYKDGILLSVDDYERFSVQKNLYGSLLTVKKAEPSDSANYTCNATNLAGTTKKTSEVKVIGKILLISYEGLVLWCGLKAY